VCVCGCVCVRACVSQRVCTRVCALACVHSRVACVRDTERITPSGSSQTSRSAHPQTPHRPRTLRAAHVCAAWTLLCMPCDPCSPCPCAGCISRPSLAAPSPCLKNVGHARTQVVAQPGGGGLRRDPLGARFRRHRVPLFELAQHALHLLVAHVHLEHGRGLKGAPHDVRALEKKRVLTSAWLCTGAGSYTGAALVAL
jgi:hypothetical protein